MVRRDRKQENKTFLKINFSVIQNGGRIYQYGNAHDYGVSPDYRVTVITNLKVPD